MRAIPSKRVNVTKKLQIIVHYLGSSGNKAEVEIRPERTGRIQLRSFLISPKRGSSY